MTFVDWYKQKHGYAPFPWQKDLASRMAKGATPASVTVPTGCGKTTIIAVFVWLHEECIPCPKRLIYIVDRRLIVDSVTTYAEKISFPVVKVIKMKGGMTIDNSWMMELNQPTVIVSTVDQAGSRLLFRGYGVSKRTAPIHAALIGNDALLVLDEAHISTPFANTLENVKKLRGDSSLPWHVVQMTATPTGERNAIGLSKKDWIHPVLKKRLFASKKAKLVKVPRKQLIKRMVEESNQLQKKTNGVVGVICNTVQNARQVFKAMPGVKILLTGRIRPKDRDRILERNLDNILCGNRDGRQPMFVVATQTIEVGADLDFDALITQNAPLDVLRQRFGRLDRLGVLYESFAVIVHESLTANEECFVYGKKILKETYSWLNKSQEGKGKNKSVDFGLSAMDKQMEAIKPPCRKVDEGVPLTEMDLLRLRQTLPQAQIDIEPFLHGDQIDNISVSVVWREDLIFSPKEDWPKIMKASPPVLLESMPCPIYEVKRWLKKRPVVINGTNKKGSSVKPGDLVVVPSSYGGYDEWGWNSESDEPVPDIGNECGANIRLIGVYKEEDVEEDLKDRGLEVSAPVAIHYPAGLIILPKKEKHRQNKAILLENHAYGVLNEVKKLTKDALIHQAAAHHDDGKKDFRFQIRLGNHDRSTLLAKSDSTQDEYTPEWLDVLPANWRHEINSLTYLPEDTPDLVKYLIATHHGFGRTVMPFGGDDDLWSRSKGSSWGELTDRLNAQYGAWGLAYLESILRLSDWVQSKEEQK
ncbi:MAG: type I-U CRISPR-associated helicase/endonuclease Cas3 [Desulfobacteraceae bacterium]|nr:type I-U CRISPR-associated helicase/endonuclease Cas3 [Desulfobacteraceae bacterium]